ncbi:hypothetical protein [Pelagicoccus sp. SDUM812003]|uniref:hypothetical protein n=1 Tax=Pelagicoccus sp. SDUM812003 TaxID=3041267 RepID=UPI00280F7B25|nr:hypothetical protein [Pelagicoccus sp. SDUM812003]MDQ8202024.1 hypothetical protein [Pelagicoccus sp. SDUM812003]
MAKVSVELIHEVLSSNELEPEVIQKVLKQIEEQAAAEAEAEKANREPPVKKQFVMIVSDPRGTLPDEDYVGWVAQIPEDDNVGTTLEKLIRASYEYNISKKGRKYPVKSIGEACEAVGARFLKEQGIAIKTKIPVTVLKTDNKIPEIESDF